MNYSYTYYLRYQVGTFYINKYSNPLLKCRECKINDYFVIL